MRKQYTDRLHSAWVSTDKQNKYNNEINISFFITTIAE